MARKWNNEGKQFLTEQFRLFQTSKGAQGINPNLSDKDEIIKQVFNQHEKLQQYSALTFAKNFVDLAKKLSISDLKTGARKQGKL